MEQDARTIRPRASSNAGAPGVPPAEPNAGSATGYFARAIV
jgi:hypothetical protein